MEDTSAVCQETKKIPDLLYSALKGEDYALVNDVVPSLTVDEFKQLAAFLCGSAEIEHLSCQSSCPPRSLHLRTRAAAARPAVCLYGRNTEEAGTHNLQFGGRHGTSSVRAGSRRSAYGAFRPKRRLRWRINIPPYFLYLAIPSGVAFLFAMTVRRNFNNC